MIDYRMPTLTPAIIASNTIRSDCTQLMLEHRLQSAATLESPHEYRFYLHQYVQRLVADGNAHFIRLLYYV
jgi:hypothetical protein